MLKYILISISLAAMIYGLIIDLLSLAALGGLALTGSLLLKREGK